jgi:hypothetical protein
VHIACKALQLTPQGLHVTNVQTLGMLRSFASRSERQVTQRKLRYHHTTHNDFNHVKPQATFRYCFSRISSVPQQKSKAQHLEPIGGAQEW